MQKDSEFRKISCWLTNWMVDQLKLVNQHEIFRNSLFYTCTSLPNCVHLQKYKNVCKMLAMSLKIFFTLVDDKVDSIWNNFNYHTWKSHEQFNGT